MRTYATMQRNRPDFFIHSGDTIYADGPICAEEKLPDGEVWKNIVTEEKAKPAETLAEFRGNYKYNLLDRNLRAFNAEVPMFAQWDDHEVTNNWWPGEPLTRAEHQRMKYVEKNALLLAARANRAFHEFMPMRETPAEPGRVYRKISYGPLLDVFMLDMRSYRGPNGEDKEETYGPAAYFLGPATGRLAQARAHGLARDLEGDRRRHAARAHRRLRRDRKWGVEGHRPGRRPAARPRARDRRPALVHQARRHPQHGLAHRRRALHGRALLRSEQGGVPGLRAVLGVRVRADPRRHLRSGQLDNTFGPQLVYVKAPSKEQGQNLPPSEGLQFFGHVAIDGATESDDGDAEGCRRSRAVVEDPGAKTRITSEAHTLNLGPPSNS